MSATSYSYCPSRYPLTIIKLYYFVYLYSTCYANLWVFIFFCRLINQMMELHFLCLFLELSWSRTAPLLLKIKRQKSKNARHMSTSLYRASVSTHLGPPIHKNTLLYWGSVGEESSKTITTAYSSFWLKEYWAFFKVTHVDDRLFTSLSLAVDRTLHRTGILVWFYEDDMFPLSKLFIYLEKNSKSQYWR